MCFLFSDTFWILITAIATCVLAVFTPIQFRILLNENKRKNNINSATFLDHLKNSFFTEEERVLILLIENDYLKFEEKEGFFINQAPPDFKKKFKSSIPFLQRDFFFNTRN